MQLALECLRGDMEGPVRGVIGARRALSEGGTVAAALLEDANIISAHETGGRLLRARLALALRVLLRADRHRRCSAEHACGGRFAGHPQVCPYRNAIEWVTTEDDFYWRNRPEPRRVRPLWLDAPPHKVAK
jgi:hypothetical protein